MKKKLAFILLVFFFLCSTFPVDVSKVVSYGSSIQTVESDGDTGDADWSMFRHDLTHTGTSPSTGPDTNNIMWSYTTGSYIDSSPAIVNGKVYIGSWDNNIYCLNADTGASIWNYTTGSYIYSSSLVVADGKVYVGSDDNNLYCFGSLSQAYLVVRGSNDYVYFRLYSCADETWGDWIAFPGSTVDAPSAAVLGNQLHVVVRGMDGTSLWHSYYDLTSESFSGWANLEGLSPSAPVLTPQARSPDTGRKKHNVSWEQSRSRKGHVRHKDGQS